MYKYVIRAEISDLKELYEVCKELMPKARFFYYRWSEDNYLKWHKLPEVGDVSNLRFSHLLFFLRLYAFEHKPVLRYEVGESVEVFCEPAYRENPDAIGEWHMWESGKCIVILKEEIRKRLPKGLEIESRIWPPE